MNILSRKLWISFIGVFIIIAAFFYGAYSLKPMPLALVHWQQSPTVIAVMDEERKGASGLLLVRLKDGKEQFINGSWDASFAPSGNSFVYQMFPATALYTASTTEQVLYAIEGANKISVVKMKDARGVVASVQENPEHTYLFIEMRGVNSTTYCVVRKLTEDGMPRCQQIHIKGTVAMGLWNKHKARELVFKTAVGELYAYDPWEKEPEKIDPQTQKSRHTALTELFDEPSFRKNTVMYNGVKNSFWKLGPVLLVRGASWSLHRVPVFARLSWLMDANHLLLQASGSLSIVELSSNRISLLFLEKGVGNKLIEVPFSPGSITMR